MVNTFPMMIAKMAMNAMARVGFNIYYTFGLTFFSPFDFKDCQGISCNIVVLHTSVKILTVGYQFFISTTVVRHFLIIEQLYGDPNHHLLIRPAGAQYLSNNPERFIESNTKNSWDIYVIGRLGGPYREKL